LLLRLQGGDLHAVARPRSACPEMVTPAVEAVKPASRATPGVLETKLHPPPGRAQAVMRDRLIGRLRPEPGVKLGLVAGPAGWGKPPLLGMWRELEGARRPIAWMTLDEGDDDPVVLWAHVREALRRVCPAVDASVAPRRVGAASVVDVVLPLIVNALTEQG